MSDLKFNELINSIFSRRRAMPDLYRARHFELIDPSMPDSGLMLVRINGESKRFLYSNSVGCLYLDKSQARNILSMYRYIVPLKKEIHRIGK